MYIDHSYDFIIYNEHHLVNIWMTEEMVKKFNKPILCIVTEVGLSTNPIAKSPPYFPYYLVLDPTVTETKQIFSFGRPLEDYNLSTVDDSKIDNDIPIIFSFGFSTPGKQWDKIVELVQNDYDRAFIHFNIPRQTLKYK